MLQKLNGYKKWIKANVFLRFIFLATIILWQSSAHAQKPRARDIGIPFSGTPGKYNAITDVKGIEVGYSTIITGDGKNIRGKGPVRTGVTASPK